MENVVDVMVPAAQVVPLETAVQAVSEEEKILMTPRTCRAARALLNMMQETLAERAGVTAQTIRNYESGRTKPSYETWRALKRVLEQEGVEFLDGDTSHGVGVWMRDPVAGAE